MFIFVVVSCVVNVLDVGMLFVVVCVCSLIFVHGALCCCLYSIVCVCCFVCVFSFKAVPQCQPCYARSVFGLGWLVFLSLSCFLFPLCVCVFVCGFVSVL